MNYISNQRSKTIYLDNTQYLRHKYFPIPVKNSVENRITKHSLLFSTLTSVFSFFYFGLRIDWRYTIRKATNVFCSRTIIAIPYFYTYQVMKAWFKCRLQMKQIDNSKSEDEDKRQELKNRKLYISEWRTNMYTSLMIFPILLCVSHIFSRKLTFRQKFMKSVCDGTLLAIFSISMNRGIENRRKKYLEASNHQNHIKIQQELTKQTHDK